MTLFRRNGPSRALNTLLPWLGWACALLAVFKGVLNAAAARCGVPFARLSAVEVPVVTSGTFNGHVFDEAALREMVETYNPAAQPAPVKLTHADKEGPAAGWVKSLRLGDFTPPGQAKPRKALFATLSLTEHGRTKVKSGEYLMRSIEAWPRNHPSNPTPGKWNYKGLALLGNDSPGCPNLGPLHLAEDASDLEVPVLLAAQEADPLTPGGKQPPATDEGAAMPLTPEQQAALDKAADIEKALAEATKKNADLEARLAAQALDADKATVKASLDGLVKDGKLTPAQAASLTPVLLALPASAEVQLAEGKTGKVREILLAHLAEGKGHGLKTPLQVPGKAPVELAAGDRGARSKRMAELVDQYKAKGKSHADAVACAAKDLDADGM